jgi:hypothetical protein
LYILDAKAPDRARLDIFERVNSGEPLTRQQMRNALYNGPATNWLKQAAEGSAFRSATGSSLNTKTMRDREAINRFCAFKLLGWRAYKTGDMDGFLAEGLARLATLTDTERTSLRTGFDRAMALNQALFGEHAFRKSLASNDLAAPRSVINISLFEVSAVTMFGIENLPKEVVTRLRRDIITLIKDEQFSKAITYSTNSTIPAQTRFATMENVVVGATLTRAGA